MDITIEIIPEQTYTLKINGLSYEGCIYVSSWNGMHEYRLRSGESVIVDKFGENIRVVKISPGIIPKMNNKSLYGKNKCKKA